MTVWVDSEVISVYVIHPIVPETDGRYRFSF